MLRLLLGTGLLLMVVGFGAAGWQYYQSLPERAPDQAKALTEMIVKATKIKAWAEALEKNAWTPALLTGPAFATFVDDEFASLRAIMVKAGMV